MPGLGYSAMASSQRCLCLGEALDLNPIDQLFAKLKNAMRELPIEPPTPHGAASVHTCPPSSPAERAKYFRNWGYGSTRPAAPAISIT